MNILLVNLTRFGDQLQSQAAINALAGLHDDGQPEHRVALICLANFTDSANLLRNLELVYPLPRDGFLSGLSGSWPKSLEQLSQWRELLFKSFKPDLVCNLTPSVSAEMLARYCANDLDVKGFALDEFGFAKFGPWAAFLQGSAKHRAVSPFNIVDLFRAVAGKSSGQVGDARLRSPDQKELTVAREYLAEKARRATGDTEHNYVAFQLGASEEQRRWPLEYFVRLGEILWQEHGLLPVLLGSAAEQVLSGRYASLSKAPYISLAGKTSLAELSSVLCCSKLLVSNDTGTMHLAAGLGCPVLGIFLATAQPWDTGPYLENCCSLEPGIACHPCTFGQTCPNDLRCRYSIEPEFLANLAGSFISTGKWVVKSELAIDEEKQSSLGVNFSGQPRIWCSETDAFRFMDLRSLSGHELEPRTLWFRAQRFFLRQFLDRNPAKPFVLEAQTEVFNCFSTEDKEKLAVELKLLEAQSGLLLELGSLLGIKPVPAVQERFLATLERVVMLLKNSQYFSVIGFLFHIEVQEQGEDLGLALEYISHYHQLLSQLYHIFK